MVKSMKKKYKLNSEVWLYPGMAGWHFVNVGKKESEEIKSIHQRTGGKIRRGFGSIPVMVTLGDGRAVKTRWKTSIFPDKQSGTYILPLKAKIRIAEGIEAGDRVNFTIDILE